MTMPSSPWTPSLIILYLWHLGDGLIHLLLESTYVYGCFAHHIEISPLPQSSPLPQQSDVRTFLGRKDRSYGNIHSSSPIASIWQEAAKADARYAKIDLTTLSLEIVTVALAGPLALYVAEKMRRDVQAKKVGKRRGGFTVGTCFWAVVLASGELYGG